MNISCVMQKYVSELELFNSAFDLVGAVKKEKIISHHILDSLAAAPFLQKKIAQFEQRGEKQVSIADVGSGAGLPGIPLADFFPDVQFTLIERMSKRCVFLENCVSVLGLKNVTVLCTEIDAKNQEFKKNTNQFDIVVFRAFIPLEEKILTLLLQLLKPHGFIAAYKAKKEKINAEMEAVKNIVPKYDLIPLDSSYLKEKNEHERNLVIIYKNQ